MRRDGEPWDPGSAVIDWLAGVVANDGFSVERSDLAASRDWRFADGAITHRSGRFFRVVGLRHAMLEQPFIEQREIGTLAFIVRSSDRGPEILLHAKVEPGNVNAAQVAPSVQATASNLDRVHGGVRPWGAALVGGAASTRLSDSLESEQGTRFLGKFNRNLSLLCDIEPPPGAPLRWVETATLLRLLDRDFVVNTDARSALTGMPWAFLAPAGPFVTAAGDFGEELRRSFRQPVGTTHLVDVDDRLARARRDASDPAIVPLGDLHGWAVGPDGTVSHPDSPLRVIHVRVASRSREVPHWDQPLLDTAATGTADLCGVRVAGAMRFGFGLCREPGLARRAELGPTVMGLDAPDRPVRDSATVVMTCRQSDEGGRFFRDITLYRIVDHGHREPDCDKVWLTVAEIRALLDRGGFFTNEARTLISVLMRHLVA